MPEQIVMSCWSQQYASLGRVGYKLTQWVIPQYYQLLCNLSWGGDATSLQRGELMHLPPTGRKWLSLQDGR